LRNLVSLNKTIKAEAIREVKIIALHKGNKITAVTFLKGNKSYE